MMNESHRYRAKAGMQAIKQLKPILELEPTATPQVISGQNLIPFKDVIYSYPLANALDDGFVKAPCPVVPPRGGGMRYAMELSPHLTRCDWRIEDSCGTSGNLHLRTIVSLGMTR